MKRQLEEEHGQVQEQLKQAELGSNYLRGERQRIQEELSQSQSRNDELYRQNSQLIERVKHLEEALSLKREENPAQVQILREELLKEKQQVKDLERIMEQVLCYSIYP